MMSWPSPVSRPADYAHPSGLWDGKAGLPSYIVYPFSIEDTASDEIGQGNGGVAAAFLGEVYHTDCLKALTSRLALIAFPLRLAS